MIVCIVSYWVLSPVVSLERLFLTNSMYLYKDLKAAEDGTKSSSADGGNYTQKKEKERNT